MDRIAEAGNPMDQPAPIKSELRHKPQRLGLMKGRVKILDDLDTMYADEIARMFNGED